MTTRSRKMKESKVWIKRDFKEVSHLGIFRKRERKRKSEGVLVCR